MTGKSTVSELVCQRVDCQRVGCCEMSVSQISTGLQGTGYYENERTDFDAN